MKKYTKFKKKIFDSAKGVALASVFFMGANSSFAQVSNYVQPTEMRDKPSGMHTMRKWNSTPRVNALANQLGISGEEMKNELKSGKTLKQILQENGLDTSELGRV